MKSCVLALLCVNVLGLAGGCGDDGKDESASKPEPDVVEDAAAPAFTCASEVCELPEGMTGELCCADNFSGGCGIMRDQQCRRLPKLDERCPMATSPGPVAAVPCCAQNGECGLDLGIGLGCIATSEACDFWSHSVIMQLGSMTCDGEELEIAADCGIDVRDGTP